MKAFSIIVRKAIRYCLIAGAALFFIAFIAYIVNGQYMNAIGNLLFCISSCLWARTAKENEEYESLTDRLLEKVKEEQDKLDHIYNRAKEAEEKGLTLIINTDGENHIVMRTGEEVTDDEKGGKE